MSRTNFPPRKDAEFLQWVIGFTAALIKIFSRVAFPEALCQQLIVLKDAFAEKYRIAEAPETRTAPAIREKTDARETLETAVTQAIAEYLTHNHLLTDSDRIALGLPVHKTGHTPAPVATEAPDIELDTSVIARIIIHFFVRGGRHRKGKPEGQHCAEVRWIIAETQPLKWDDLIHSAVDTNSPFTLEFENDQRGKNIYFALRWENTRGEKGPWSPILNAIIP